MKLIIAGTRTLQLPDGTIEGLVLAFDLAPLEVVCGGAHGIDYSGHIWAGRRCYPVKMFLADWEKHGKAAGPIRNKLMALYADELLLVWDGVSRGSANMKKEMLALKKPVYECILKGVPV
jgi:hypothetical protein